MNKPIIGISCNERADFDGWFDTNRIFFARKDATRVVSQAKGLPIMIPVNNDKKDIEEYIDLIDGLIITGGHDVLPATYLEDMNKSCGDIHPDTDMYDIQLIKAAFDRKIPTIVICRGLQITNVAFGGTLYQDVNDEMKSEIKHHAPKEGNIKIHQLNIIEPNSLFSSITSISDILLVNSIHHQAINKLSPLFKVIAKANDSVIEIIELKDNDHFFIGMQFHPEILASHGDEKMLKLFCALVNEAETYKKSKKAF